MTPLRREWQAVREQCDALWAKVKAAPAAARKSTAKTASRKTAGPRDSKTRREHDRVLQDFVERLAHVTILDPACGSGNFLYVAINLLLNLEKEVIVHASKHGTALLPQVRPTQLLGIEINPYAQQLAQVVIWIGYLQWKHHNAFPPPRNPVLEPIESIKLMDAILDLSDPENPKEPKWPKADFIVGNPPFVGDKKLRGELGDQYVETLRKLYEGRLPGQSDLCCYWFEKARDAIARKRTRRAGLLATQGIRGGGNRKALERIKESGEIYWAISDHDWVLDGALVHVSMVGFCGKDEEATRVLDGNPVSQIHSNLTSGAATTEARVLPQNEGVSFLGNCKGGAFDIDEVEALHLVLHSGNPNRRPNSDVIVPTQNSRDILQFGKVRWIIDNADRTLEDACLYSEPHRIVVERVKPHRDSNRNEWLKINWWRPQRMRPAMRTAIKPLTRFFVTTTTSKHRIFVWLTAPTLPDHQLIVFARDDDYFFGVAHSHAHEVWSLSRGTQLREKESGFRYTPTTCFETFPFPNPTPAQRDAIAAAARELDRLRTAWLNPPEWTREEVLEFPGSVDGPWARFVHEADAKGIGTVRYPRVVARDEECAGQLAGRTLTNLYNQRPTWLASAHEKLDAAVAEAYGWPADLSEEEILARLLALNLERA